jgi:hypothetical protein
MDQSIAVHIEVDPDFFGAELLYREVPVCQVYPLRSRAKRLS